MKKVIFVSTVLLFFLGITNVWAQEESDFTYEVSYSNCSKIQISGKKAVKGMRFNDKEQIQWAKDVDNQALKVSNCKNGVYELFVFNYKEKRVVLVTSRETSTGAQMKNDSPIIVFDTVYYLLDTLKISTLTKKSSNVVDKVIVHTENELFEVVITKSKDGMEYVIPRSVLGKHDKKPFYLDVVEKDNGMNWEYAVWRKLYVKPLPLKVD